MPRRCTASLAALSVVLTAAIVRAEKGADLKPVLTKPGSVVLDESFSGPQLGKAWLTNKGEWPIQDGTVVGSEKKADMHAAVLTLQHPHRNSIVRFSFKLDGATGFNLSFNHAKGHLFRIAVSETGLTVNKDKDKKDPDSKIVAIGKASGTFESGKWHTMLVETHDGHVTVQTDNGVQLDACDVDLNVDKTGYRFVMRGQSLLLDDIKIWNVER